MQASLLVASSPARITEIPPISIFSIISAGAKNFNDVVIVPSKAEYPVLLQLLNKQGAKTGLEDRRMFAERAFGISNQYDKAIHNWFAK